MLPVEYIPFRFPKLPNVGVAFSTRKGGYGKAPYDKANYSYEVGDDEAIVTAHRESYMKRLGFEVWQETKQVHGDTIIFEPEENRYDMTPVIEADGIATSKAGQGLVIKTADCQPVLFAHNSGRYIMALHVGWRGNVLNLCAKGVVEFCEHYDLLPKDIYAVRGPSLGPESAQFTNFHKEFGPAFEDYFNEETQTMDLWALTKDQLIKSGLKEEHIFGLDFDTCKRTDNFFSYRADNTTGRQANVIWFK